LKSIIHKEIFVILNSSSLYLFLIFSMISSIQGSIKYFDNTNLVENGTRVIYFKNISEHDYRYNFTYFKNIETGENYIFSAKDFYEKAAQEFSMDNEQFNLILNGLILMNSNVYFLAPYARDFSRCLVCRKYLINNANS